MTSKTAPSINWPVVAVALGAIITGTLYIIYAVPAGKPALFLLGALMGATLYHAAFGFTAGWRQLVNERRSAGMRAQMLTFAIAAMLILPVLNNGEIFGHGVIGANAPVGVAMVLGAFVFGFGMQLGGGCASGTLYTVGGGSARMLVTLVFFLAGSVLGSAHLPWWFTTPKFKTFSLLQNYGLLPTLAITLVLLSLIALISTLVEKRAHGTLNAKTEDTTEKTAPLARLLRGPWPLIWGGVLLALGNFGVVALTGHTWSISFGYALWGAKALGLLGIDLSQTEFWTWGYPARALKGSLFAEDTSVMNLGIVAGAALAAGLAGTFGKARKIPFRSLLAAALGGLLMGYGARLASGCNIGALFSGIASGSLHGWAWLLAGFAGSYIGIKARPWFQL